MTDRILLGHIGVDSGQMMLVDPCYLSEWKDTDFDFELIEQYKQSRVFPLSYNGACAATLQQDTDPDAFGGILTNDLGIGVAAVSDTGYGDGMYEVWIEVDHIPCAGRRVTKMEIIFIEDEEDYYD